KLIRYRIDNLPFIIFTQTQLGGGYYLLSIYRLATRLIKYQFFLSKQKDCPYLSVRCIFIKNHKTEKFMHFIQNIESSDE
ncbi:hypothetical protein EAY16_17120, partial [Vibrio anguillarum]